MVTSSGLDTSPDNSTPQGIFYIQPEKGKFFYSNSEHEGAEYFVSWKNHGEFLFHSVPTDRNGKVIEEEARKLGQKASHGCFRLTIPDAKWIYENIPINTKVVIHS
jgi:lipoprotein-anchoring transpeptidase ErfK/SrfK